jgi:ribosome-associated protein
VSQDQTIRLGQALKALGLVATGGEAKHLIQAGEVRVNDQVETRRKRQLRAGDVITVGEQSFTIEFEVDPDADGGL